VIPERHMARMMRDLRETKERSTIVKGIEDMRPMLMGYDDHGYPMVSVLLASVAHDHVLKAGGVVVSAWEPWALGFVAEGYVAVTPPEEDVDLEGYRHGDMARRFANNDRTVGEALIVELHYRTPDGISVLTGTAPFTYVGGHAINWGEQIITADGGGGLHDALVRAMTAPPARAIVPEADLAAAIRAAVRVLIEMDCAVVVTGEAIP
jgi:hypothetical protein